MTFRQKRFVIHVPMCKHYTNSYYFCTSERDIWSFIFRSVRAHLFPKNRGSLIADINNDVLTNASGVCPGKSKLSAEVSDLKLQLGRACDLQPPRSMISSNSLQIWCCKFTGTSASFPMQLRVSKWFPPVPEIRCCKVSRISLKSEASRRQRGASCDLLRRTN